MKTDPKAKLPVPAKRPQTLTKVLGKSEQATELVKESAKDLASVKEQADIAMIAEKIIKAIQAPCNIGLRDLEIQPTAGASIGISIFPESGAAADALVKRADDAMFRKKQDAAGYAFARVAPPAG